MEAILELIVTWPIELSVAIGIPLLLEVVDLHVLEFKAVAQPEGVEVRGGGEGGSGSRGWKSDSPWSKRRRWGRGRQGGGSGWATGVTVPEIVLCDIGGEEIRRGVKYWEELRDVVGADEELGVVLLDACHPAVLDLMRVAWVQATETLKCGETLKSN